MFGNSIAGYLINLINIVRIVIISMNKYITVKLLIESFIPRLIELH